MSAIDFGTLREGLPGCPSDLAIDRFIAHALAEAEQQTVSSHIQGCERCTGRIAARSQGFDSYPDVDERKLLAALRRRLDEVEAERRASLGHRLLDWLRVPRQFAMASGALTAAALLVVFLRPSVQPLRDDGAGPDGIRLKGGLALHVYRQRGDHAEELVSSDYLHPGDNLRFAVDLPKEGRVSVVGIDARGTLYVAWPLPQDAAAKAPSPANPPQDSHRPAGRRQQLPGAVTLDESLGDESLYLVHCPAQPGGAGPLPGCDSQGSGQPPACPKGCALVSFPFKKVP